SKECVERYCGKYFNLEAQSPIVEKFSRYIQEATQGHVGLIFHTLRHTKEAMERRIRENVLSFKDVFAYLNSREFDLTVDRCRASPKVKSLSSEQLKICEMVYTFGEVPFNAYNTSMLRLIKSGILVIDHERLFFSAPLIERSFFQQCYGSHNTSETTPESLYHFIVRIFTAMCDGPSGKILREALGFGTDGNLLEQTWQKEFYRVGTQVLGINYFLSCDVGAVFGCDGYVDFYVDKLDWAIELLRD
ncbi:10129_t:CDS:1, partial [Paraglomus occultum]